MRLINTKSIPRKQATSTHVRLWRLARTCPAVCLCWTGPASPSSSLIYSCRYEILDELHFKPAVYDLNLCMVIWLPTTQAASTLDSVDWLEHALPYMSVDHCLPPPPQVLFIHVDMKFLMNYILSPAVYDFDYFWMLSSSVGPSYPLEWIKNVDSMDIPQIQVFQPVATMPCLWRCAYFTIPRHLLRLHSFS